MGRQKTCECFFQAEVGIRSLGRSRWLGDGYKGKGRMLEEFRGHGSYVNFCAYQLLAGSSQLLVVTGSADGTVRLWDGKTSDVVRVLRPISLFHIHLPLPTLSPL